MKFLNKAVLAVTTVALSVGVAVAQEAPVVDVTDQADTFLSNFSGAATTVGGVLISAAFIAIVWKWIKGMAFN